MNCNSTYNGCSACAPNLTIYYIEASTSQIPFGFGCEFPQEGAASLLYKSRTINSLMFEDSYTAWFTFDNGEGNRVEGVDQISKQNGQYSSSQEHVFTIDKHGLIIIGFTENTSWKQSSFYKNTNNESTSIDNNYSSITIPSKSLCEVNRNFKNGTVDSVNEAIYSNCIGGGECDQQYGCNSINVKSSRTLKYNDPPHPQFGGGGQTNSYERISYELKLSNPLTKSFFYNLCKQSVSKKIQVLQDNSARNCQNLKCGNGEKDDCWQPFNTVEMSNNQIYEHNINVPVYSQKLKFIITIPKEKLVRGFKLIEGKVYFYYDGEEGETPCCQPCGGPDCFSGTIIKEVSFSIKNESKPFRKNLISEEIGDLDNNNSEHIGKTIRTCYVINRLDYI